MVIFSWDVSTFTYLQSTMNYVKYRVWGVTLECECWCWCHRVKVGRWWCLITVNSVHTCFLSVTVQCQCYVYIKPTTTDLKKVSGIIVWWSGEISPPHLRWKCFLFRIDRIGREGGGRGGLKVDGNMKKQIIQRNIKYVICSFITWLAGWLAGWEHKEIIIF